MISEMIVDFQQITCYHITEDRTLCERNWFVREFIELEKF
jgi:hypothetical protein